LASWFIGLLPTIKLPKFHSALLLVEAIGAARNPEKLTAFDPAFDGMHMDAMTNQNVANIQLTGNPGTSDYYYNNFGELATLSLSLLWKCTTCVQCTLVVECRLLNGRCF
jgi:hypothetical protein